MKRFSIGERSESKHKFGLKKVCETGEGKILFHKL